jgi:hypothetical protein
MAVKETNKGREVLYEGKLVERGRRVIWASLLGYFLYAGVVTIGLSALDSFRGNIDPIIGLNVGGLIIFGVAFVFGCRWRRNPGFYRISIDDYGLYVQSDDRSCGPAFAVVATDLQALVRVECIGSETHYYEYRVRTKSGAVYQLFDFGDLDHDALFDRILNRFHWVEFVEEVENKPL